MIKNKEKGFALVLSLVLLLAMSLMGGGLVVIASSDHQSNNSSDEYQQTFYVAETALMQAEKSLVDKMIGPINIDGLNLIDATKKLEKLLEDELFAPGLEVTLKTSRPLSISVVGEINRPGVYKLEKDNTFRNSNGNVQDTPTRRRVMTGNGSELYHTHFIGKFQGEVRATL